MALGEPPECSEVRVARAPIALMVGKTNHFVDRLSLDQARAIWRRASPAATWADVDPTLPNEPIEPVGWKPDSPAATMLAEALFGPVDPLEKFLFGRCREAPVGYDSPQKINARTIR